MLFPVDAILFDIDGTLVDSTAAVIRTWQAWAAPRGIDAEEILRVCHGRRTEDTIAMFLPPAQQAAAVTELEQLELDDLNEIIALPATRSLLSRLPADRWAAVTSGSQRLMRARLTAAGLPIPRVLIAAEDVKAGKPDPEGYAAAAAALGHDIRRCLVVEDAPAGIEAGRAAGARVLAVATSHPASDLTTADTLVPDLTACRLEVTATGLLLSTTS
ncbi:HAD family hydrolase [Actinoplanes subtropicus]|uniref:HAD family hydrolase n=1 Tax=Actinoplanes subtropicus TaxID=543632 RepID=UPI0004C2BD43|nr:HAD family hydrolase [Actinoplanes subtropicus]